MLFFPPPPAATTDLMVDPAVDGLLLSGVLRPSMLEQEQRNQQAQQLQRQLLMMEQQLQQHQQQVQQQQGSLPPPSTFNGLLASQIGGGGGGVDATGGALLLPPATMPLMPAGISPLSAGGNQLTQLAPSSARHQQIDTNNSIAPMGQPNLSLQPTGPCNACNQPIVEKSFLLVDGQSWHSECVRCAICGQNLESDGPTCFVRDGFLFCQRDYFAKFGKPCERCGVPIARGELVMRVPRCGENALFHIHCFSCIYCGQLLAPGQQYTVGPSEQPGGPLFCSAHFHVNPLAESFEHFPPPAQNPSGEEQGHFLAEMCPSNGIANLGQQIETTANMPPPPPDQFSTIGANSPPINNNSAHMANAAEGHNHHPFLLDSAKENPEAIRLSSASVTPNGTEGYCGHNGGGSSNGAETPGGTGGGGGSGRQKRMRTSFKHHQLRTMKTYFGLNHNPDAKDLKQLAQKTGLTKRVLQVWFQNARAKFRRNQQHRGGGAHGMDGAGGMLSAMSGGHIPISAGQIHSGGYVPNGGGGCGINGEIMLTIPPPSAIQTGAAGSNSNNANNKMSSNNSSSNGPTSMGDGCSTMASSSSASSSVASSAAADERAGGGGGGSQSGDDAFSGRGH